MKWAKKGATAIESIDGNWTICKVMLKGVWTYECWRKQANGWQQMRVHLPSRDAALEIVKGGKREY